MAKVRNNIFVRGLTGAVGDQFVIRQDRAGRTIIANTPTFKEDRAFTSSQMEQQERFRDAVEYAKSAKSEEAYIKKAEGTTKTPYNVAVADWFHEPEVREIDMNNWDGSAGAPIRIRAIDDVEVTQVNVVITNADGSEVLEQGAAVKDDKNWWTYTTQTQISGTPRVVVTAHDIPGHIATLEWSE